MKKAVRSSLGRKAAAAAELSQRAALEAIALRTIVKTDKQKREKSAAPKATPATSAATAVVQAPAAAPQAAATAAPTAAPTAPQAAAPVPALVQAGKRARVPATYAKGPIDKSLFNDPNYDPIRDLYEAEIRSREERKEKAKKNKPENDLFYLTKSESLKEANAFWEEEAQREDELAEFDHVTELDVIELSRLLAEPLAQQEKQGNEKKSKESMLATENARMNAELEDFKAAAKSLAGRIEADSQQISQLTSQKTALEKSTLDLEEQLGTSRRECAELHTKLALLETAGLTLRLDLQNREHMIADLKRELETGNGNGNGAGAGTGKRNASAGSLGDELEGMRSQFAELRQHLVRRQERDDRPTNDDIDTRAVYDSTIVSLRSELNFASVELSQCKAQLEQERLKNQRLLGLEEDLQYYREAARLAAEEAAEAIQSAGIAIEKSCVKDEEWQGLTRELSRVKSELDVSQRELLTAQTILVAEKSGSRALELKMLACERKLAELSSQKMRGDSANDETRRRAVLDVYNKETLERSLLQEQEKSRELSAQLESLGADNRRLTMERGDMERQIGGIQRQVLDAEQNARSQEREKNALIEALATQKTIAQSLSQELERLHGEWNSIKSDKDAAARAISNDERRRTELQVQALRSDIEDIQSQLASSDLLRESQLAKIAALEGLFSKERDLALALKTELRLIADKLTAATEELSVFKDLDAVYSKSKHAALSNSRTKSYLSKPTSGEDDDDDDDDESDEGREPLRLSDFGASSASGASKVSKAPRISHHDALLARARRQLEGRSTKINA